LVDPDAYEIRCDGTPSTSGRRFSDLLVPLIAILAACKLAIGGEIVRIRVLSNKRLSIANPKGAPLCSGIRVLAGNRRRCAHSWIGTCDSRAA
jgi:hypothetical protein